MGAQEDEGQGYDVEQAFVAAVVFEVDGAEAQAPVAVLFVAKQCFYPPPTAVGVHDVVH